MDDLFDVSLQRIQLIAIGPNTLRRAEREIVFCEQSNPNDSEIPFDWLLTEVTRGNPQNGFLRMNEIYSLKLRSELVVLSACETALGKDVRGEGLIGLTRGFMYAGSPRVIASLWRVPDRATSELMKRFYGGLFRGGLRPAAALRAAQLDMRKTLRWSSPYYWAGFILQGEWQ